MRGQRRKNTKTKSCIFRTSQRTWWKFFNCKGSKCSCRRLSLWGQAWDDQRWWQGHRPMSWCPNRLSVKHFCSVRWKRRSLPAKQEKNTRMTHRNAFKLAKKLLFSLIWILVQSKLSWGKKNAASHSLVGNVTLCKLVIWQPKKGHMSHPPAILDCNLAGLWGFQRNDQRALNVTAQWRNRLSHSQCLLELQWAVFN